MGIKCGKGAGIGKRIQYRKMYAWPDILWVCKIGMRQVQALVGEKIPQ